MPLPAIAQNKFSGVDHVLDSKRKSLGGNICALILKDDKVIYTYKKGKYDENTSELIASCSKWLTTALVMTFVDEGKLSVDDPVSRYLPELSKNGKDKILIRHCISHTTAIKSDPITLANLAKRKKYFLLADEVKSFAERPLIDMPGNVFAYSNIGLNIAGRVLEVISGKDFETLFQERIARPLGMTSTTFKGKQAVNPSGSARSTPSDYLKFLEMILHKGKYNRKQIISESSIAAMQTSQTSKVKVLYAPEQAVGLEYGYGEWIHSKDSHNRGIVISSPGLFGTFPYIDRTGNYAVIVFMKNLKVKGRKEIYQAIMLEIAKVL